MEVETTPAPYLIPLEVWNRSTSAVQAEATMTMTMEMEQTVGDLTYGNPQQWQAVDQVTLEYAQWVTAMEHATLEVSDVTDGMRGSYL
eukprot:8012360-Pyramimonas_sp.AAC.1